MKERTRSLNTARILLAEPTESLNQFRTYWFFLNQFHLNHVWHPMHIFRGTFKYKRNLPHSFQISNLLPTPPATFLLL